MAEYNKIEKRFLKEDYRDECEFRNLPDDDVDMWIELLCCTINADIVNLKLLLIHINKGMKGITEKDFGGMVKAASLGQFKLPYKPVISSRLLGEMWSTYIQLKRGGKVGMQIEKEKTGLTGIEKDLINIYYKAIGLCTHFDTYKERSNYSEWKKEKGLRFGFEDWFSVYV